jgi:hypothetical protein
MKFLEANKIRSIFPNREGSYNELEEKIQSGSLQKMRNWDNGITNLIIGKNSLTLEEKLKALEYLKNELGDEAVNFIEKKQNLYKSIMKKGFIKSRLEILDAIEIANSEILGLTDDEKIELNKIIHQSMLSRI